MEAPRNTTWERVTLPEGHAIPVAIGAPLPLGTTAVLPVAQGVIDIAPNRTRLQVADAKGQPTARPGLIPYGHAIRPQGSDAAAGQRLLAAGPVVTPATVALAACIGRDDLTVIPPPSVAVVLPRFGLARQGPLRPGRQRDAVAELLPSWIEAGPARLIPTISAEADDRRIAAAIKDAPADVVIVSGGIEPGIPADVERAVAHLKAQPLISGLAVAPGAATAVYALSEDRYLIVLPGRPSAAAAGLAIALDPLLAALSGRSAQLDGVSALLASRVAQAGPGATLVPGIVERMDLVLKVHPRPWDGPSGLQSLAEADGLIVCEPGSRDDALVHLLPLPGVHIG